jgi:hypothetical protein
MNRVLKRPMFRIGGSAGTGITSGLDQPRKQYANGSEYNLKDYERERRMIEEMMRQEQLRKEMELDLKKKKVREQKQMAADGGRIGYANGTQMPTFQPGGVPGFLTGFGLNLLATPPQGNIFQTAAVAAKDPFDRLQAQQIAEGKTAAEREFLRREREAGDDAAMKRLKLKLASDEKIAGMKTDDALYNVMLEQYIENDLPPQAAERAALFSTQNADTLRAAVTGQRYGGVLTFDVRDPNVPKKSLKNLDGKVVYDPFEDNYKYIVVKDGEIFFDEFNTIAEIKFPDLTLKQEKEKIQNFESDVFSPRLEDAQA